MLHVIAEALWQLGEGKEKKVSLSAHARNVKASALLLACQSVKDRKAEGRLSLVKVGASQVHDGNAENNVKPGDNYILVFLGKQLACHL